MRSGLLRIGSGHADKTALSGHVLGGPGRRRVAAAARPGAARGPRVGPRPRPAGYRGRVISVQRSEDRFRGGDEAAGIETRHAFSFGSFYDPDNLRFGPVMACNEERLAPGAGFDEHPHSHTEIVTWVVEGELTHRDSTGHATVVRPGGLQHLSAAAGVRHVERNDGSRPLTFIQMWLAPLEPGGEPAYTTVPELADTTPYALPVAGAVLHVRRPAPGERVPLPAAAARAYVHVAAGEVRIGGAGSAGPAGAVSAESGGAVLRPGDAARITGETGLELTAAAGPAEVLIWELPA